MKSIKSIIAAFIIVATITSCKKDKIDTTPPNPNVPITEAVKDIYVGGSENETWADAPANSLFLGSYAKSNARVWKNGVQMPVTGSPFSSGVNDIAVLGNDVYAVGTFDTAAYNPLNQIMVKPTIWKNGVPTFLSAPGKGGGCRRIEISGNDIYVTGYEYGISSTGTGIVWKNGVVIFSEPNTSINDIKVVGSDVYMVLRQGIGSGGAGSLWKNGVYTNISSTPNTAYPLGLAVVGADVYICGFKTGGQFFKAMLWKNGVETELSSGLTEAAAYAVTVNNGDIYVVGRRKINLIPANPNNPLLYTAVVWKNGNEISTYNYYPTGVIDGMENTGWLGIEFVAGTEYLVGFSDRTLNTATGYYTSRAFTSKAGGPANFPFTLTNMAVTAGTQYGGVKAISMFITKQ
jgi:hypothetical protein